MEGLLAPGKEGPPSSLLSHSVIAAGSWYGVGGKMRERPARVATESCCQISQFGSHYWELPSHDSQLDSDYSPLSNAP